MQAGKLIERILLALAALITVVVLLPSAWLPEELNRDYLVYTLALILLFALTRYARIMLILAVGGLVLLANLPGVTGIEMDREVILLTLGLVVLGAGLNYFFNLLPTGIDTAPKRSASTQGVTALISAVRNGETVRVKRFIDAGVNLDGMVDNETPLTVAAKMGHADIVQMLVEAGADTSLPNGSGETAVQLAERAGHKTAVGYLTE